ncbi:MAG: hypothetical protein ACRDTA_04585 [Pseudonocardiaceae bacterium]
MIRLGANWARTAEGDFTAGELRSVEGDYAAGELRSVKPSTIKRGVREVEVTTTPGGRSAEVLEVIADDGVPDFSLAFAVFLAGRVGLVRHAQISAQDVYAHLALLNPVVGELGHGVHTSESDSGFFVPELLGDCGVALGKLFGVGLGVHLPRRVAACGSRRRRRGRRRQTRQR